MSRPLAGFMLGAAGMFATMYSTQAILPELSRDFGISPSRAGLSISVVVLAVAIGGFAWGPVSDRIGRPRAIRMASLLLVPPTLGVALAPGFEALLVCRALQGLCMPGLLAVGAPYVVEAFVPRIGARAMGYYVSALVAGGLVGRLGVALASTVVGWRVAIGVLAVLPLVAAIAMRAGLPEPALPSRGGGIARHLTNPRLLGVSVGGGALFFTFVGTFTYVTYRLEEPPFSYSVGAASLVFLLWLTGLAGPLAGTDRRPGRLAATGARHGRPLRRRSPADAAGRAAAARRRARLHRRRDVHGLHGDPARCQRRRAGSTAAPPRRSTSASTTAPVRSARTSRASRGRSGDGAVSRRRGSSRSLLAAAGIAAAGHGGEASRRIAAQAVPPSV